ncbi:MAG: TolC family protein [Gemmataceae bacterium]|nr:TolC family protein [Gemmataceae bacterium]
MAERRRPLSGIVLLFVLVIGLPAHGAEPENPTWTPVPPSVLTLDLEECIGLALQKQPALAAHRASLGAAEDARRALANLCIPNFLSRELPIRRHQSALGVTAASAAVDQAERETIYAVTRAYFTVLYARQQEQVARGVVDRLSTVNEIAGRMLKEGARDVTATDVDRTAIYQDLAEARRIQAAKGVERGLASLKEAIGLPPGCTIQVPPGKLPEPNVRPCRPEIVAWALARRGELIQAGVFTEITCLEIEAQATSAHVRVETFAIGADIHAQQVPQEHRNAEFRPGAVPPEMPAQLAGSRAERVEHAKTLSARAGAVADKARNLIVLEAEDAFLRWEEATAQAAVTLRAATRGDTMADGVRKDFVGGQKVRVEDVMNAQVLAAQARSQYHEYLYHQILALADLERVTGGGFCAGLAGPPRPPK